MKLTLEVRNFKKIIKPTKNDVILYDGHEWYVTTTEDLFAELNKRFEEREMEIDRKIEKMSTIVKEFEQIKVDNAKQIASMSKTLRELLSGGLK